jgi:hypothetical protein
MRDGGELLNIGHVQLGVAQTFGVDGAGLRVDCSAQAIEVICIHKAHRDAEARQCVVEQVVSAAVERGGGDDLVAGAGQCGEGKGLRGLTGGRGQRRRSAFESRHALFKHVRGGVHDARVDVTELLQSEEAPRVVCVLKDVGGGLVDGHGARTGGGVGRLAGVNGKSGKVLLGFGHLLSSPWVGCAPWVGSAVWAL